MEFTSYQLISNNTSSLNSASYLNTTEYSLFVNDTKPDFWYGMSENDVVELGVWDRHNNFVGWNILPSDDESISTDNIIYSYTNKSGNEISYSVLESEPEFTLYKNDKIKL